MTRDLVLHCVACGAPFRIALHSRTHPVRCPRCAGLPAARDQADGARAPSAPPPAPPAPDA